MVTTDGLDQVLVRNILEHPTDYPWRWSDIGLLGLRLDDQREFRMHIWVPDRRLGGRVIHDHPYDFTSRIVVGEITNLRYVEDPSGDKYLRERYAPADEEHRTADLVQLAATVETYRAGDRYAQLAHELHDSRPLPGTVSLLRCSFREVGELTVCRPEDAPWVSGRSRPPTPAEVAEISALALAWF
jgi:hypothetical protein